MPTSTRPAVILAALSAMWFVCSAVVFAQDRPQRQTERFNGSGVLKDMRGNVLLVLAADGGQLLVKAPERPLDLAFNASADVDWLKRGMLVRFTGQFDKRGQAVSPIGELTVFTPRPEYQVGVFADSGFGGGNDLFAEKKVETKEPDSAPYMVAGTLSAMKGNKITVAAGGVSVKVELAENVRVSVDVNDLRFAREGDKVMIEGWFYPGDERSIVAQRLTVTAAEPLGTSDKVKKGPNNSIENLLGKEKPE